MKMEKATGSSKAVMYVSFHPFLLDALPLINYDI